MENVYYGLNEVHAVQVFMLKKLIAVCGDYNLSYFLAFGSLLGAVREHKIIAWDDSIDVVMPYNDYRRLIALPRETWGADLFLQTNDTDPEYPNCYAKLRDSRTTFINADYADLDIHHGIYINIMPLISLADDARGRHKQIRNAKRYKALIGGFLPATDKLLGIFLSLFCLSERCRTRMCKKAKEKLLRYEDKDTKDCIALAGSVSLTLPLPKAWFASSNSMEFEGMMVNVPVGWHEWLTLRYGDYMVAPISELQSDKISRIVTLSTDKPYTEYKGITYCIR